MKTVRFELSELSCELPTAGVYSSTITSARLRRSSRGNTMVEVEHALDGVPAAYVRLVDYFAIEGANRGGRLWARRRLAELFRACGVEPQVGDVIAPDDLVGARLEVEVEHEQWHGEQRLRVVAHHRVADDANWADAETPF